MRATVQLDSEIIRGIMIERQLGVAELGKMAGIANSTIGKFASRDSKASYKVIGRLSKALNVNYKELLKKEEVQKC